MYASKQRWRLASYEATSVLMTVQSMKSKVDTQSTSAELLSHDIRLKLVFSIIAEH